MTDPLNYMNALMVWDDPPERSEQWERTLAEACVLIAERDDELARFREQQGELRRELTDAKAALATVRLVTVRTVPVEQEQTLWEFPFDRFVSYGGNDERWARPLGFGREITQLVKTQCKAVCTGMRTEPPGADGIPKASIDFTVVAQECTEMWYQVGDED